MDRVDGSLMGLRLNVAPFANPLVNCDPRVGVHMLINKKNEKESVTGPISHQRAISRE
jgi:hypothetical protein